MSLLQGAVEPIYRGSEYSSSTGERITTNWAAQTCGHPVCSKTAVYWRGLNPDTQGELCPACAGEYLTRLYRQEADALQEAAWLERDVAAYEEQLTDREKEVAELSAAILALAAELDGQAIVGMGIRDIAKRLRDIAG